MRDDMLPLFPINVVLFPRTLLPLHIFEDRYKEMIGAVMETGSEFGIVLARSSGVVSTGCTATVERVLERYEDGRLDILTIGRRRFDVNLLNQQKAYLRAEVQYFDDEIELETAPLIQRTKVLECFYALQKLDSETVIGEPSLDDPQLSFQLAQIVDDVDFRQRLLQVRSESTRIRLMVDYLPELVEQKQVAAHVRRTAPLNGHGPLPKSFSA